MGDQLDAFRRVVDWELACGSLADIELPVTSDDGEFPVVVALESERLSTLLGRLRAVGWSANVFMRVRGECCAMSVVTDACAIPVPDDVMTGDESPGVGATVGMFYDHVVRNPNGVTISAAVGHPACARDPRPVEAAST